MWAREQTIWACLCTGSFFPFSHQDLFVLSALDFKCKIWGKCPCLVYMFTNTTLNRLCFGMFTMETAVFDCWSVPVAAKSSVFIPVAHQIAPKQALHLGYSEISFRMVRGRAREGEPAMVLAQFEFCLLFRLTDLSSYQIEMNQSQQKQKWPCRSRRLSKVKLLIHVHLFLLWSWIQKLRRKHFDEKLEENRSIYKSVPCQ